MPFNTTVVKGTTDVSVPIMVVDATDGTPETGYDHSTSGIDLWYRREGGLEVSITEAALAAANSAHTDGGVEHISDGRGRLDLPDAACEFGTDGAGYCEYGGTITGMVVIGGTVELTNPVNELFETAILGSTDNDTTHVHIPSWTFGNDEINNRLIAIKDVSEDEWHIRWVTDWVLSTNLATLNSALPFTPADAADLAALLPGDRTDIVNIEADTQDIQTNIGTPTGADLATDIAANQTDLNSIIAAVITNAAGADVAADIIAMDAVADAIKVITDQMVFTKANELDVNTQSINGAAVIGDGNATPWDGA